MDPMIRGELPRLEWGLWGNMAEWTLVRRVEKNGGKSRQLEVPLGADTKAGRQLSQPHELRPAIRLSRERQRRPEKFSPDLDVEDTCPLRPHRMETSRHR